MKRYSWFVISMLLFVGQYAWSMESKNFLIIYNGKKIKVNGVKIVEDSEHLKEYYDEHKNTEESDPDYEKYYDPGGTTFKFNFDTILRYAELPTGEKFRDKLSVQDIETFIDLVSDPKTKLLQHLETEKIILLLHLSSFLKNKKTPEPLFLEFFKREKIENLLRTFLKEPDAPLFQLLKDVAPSLSKKIIKPKTIVIEQKEVKAIHQLPKENLFLCHLQNGDVVIWNQETGKSKTIDFGNLKPVTIISIQPLSTDDEVFLNFKSENKKEYNILNYETGEIVKTFGLGKVYPLKEKNRFLRGQKIIDQNEKFIQYLYNPPERMMEKIVDFGKKLFGETKKQPTIIYFNALPLETNLIALSIGAGDKFEILDYKTGVILGKKKGSLHLGATVLENQNLLVFRYYKGQVIRVYNYKTGQEKWVLGTKFAISKDREFIVAWDLNKYARYITIYNFKTGQMQQIESKIKIQNPIFPFKQLVFFKHRVLNDEIPEINSAINLLQKKIIKFSSHITPVLMLNNQTIACEEESKIKTIPLVWALNWPEELSVAQTFFVAALLQYRIDHGKPLDVIEKKNLREIYLEMPSNRAQGIYDMGLINISPKEAGMLKVEIVSKTYEINSQLYDSEEEEEEGEEVIEIE